MTGADADGIADLHLHTHFSDGSDSPEAVLQWAARIGLDVIAITDHDTIAGAERAAELACTGVGPDVIVGEEVSSREGHILALFISHRIAPGLSAAATIAAIHEQGGLALAAHPYWRLGQAARNRYAYSVGEAIESLDFDAVETINGGITPGMLIANRRAQAVAAAHGHACVAGSDAHVRQAIGWATTRFRGSSAADLLAAIVAGRTRPSRSAPGLAGVRSYAAWSLGRRGLQPVAG